MPLLWLAAGVVGWLVASLAAARWVRRRAGRIETSAEAVPDKVHRLQRLMLGSFASVVVLYVAAGAVAGAVAGAHHRQHRSTSGAEVAVGVLTALLIGAAAIVPVVLVPRPARQALARVRDVPLRVPDRRRRVLAASVIGLGYAVLLVGGRLLVPAHGAAHVIGMALVYGVAVVVLASVIMPLAIVRLRTTPMPADLRHRLRILADDAGVRVRDFRVLQSRSQKIANAAQVGTIPGLRYIVVTDYLIDHFSPEQLDAVIAHELAHARRHHILIKLGAVLAAWAVLEAVAVTVGHLTGHGWAALIVAPIFLAVPLGMILVQGLVGVRLEQSADDLAAAQVGAEPLSSALERLADLNDTKRRTGRGWSLITQHPGVQARLDRLHARPQPGS